MVLLSPLQPVLSGRHEIIGFKATGDDRTPILVALTKEGKHVVVAGNLGDQERTIRVNIGKKQLKAVLAPTPCTRL